jgi:hypothetical protein
MKIHLNLPIFFMLPILFLSLGARADIYQWKDARGQTHVTTTAPPKNASAQKVTVSEPGRPRPLDRSIAVPSPKAKATGPLPFLQPAASSQVEIYSAPWCGFYRIQRGCGFRRRRSGEGFKPARGHSGDGGQRSDHRGVQPIPVRFGPGLTITSA